MNKTSITGGNNETKVQKDDSKDSKQGSDEEQKHKKKLLFDSNLVQLDLFSPFPIPLFNSNFLRRSLNRIMFKENKIAYLKPKFVQL